MKNKRRRIFLLIFLIIIILIEIRALRNSVANKLIDITATITDNSSLLAVQEYTTKASTDSEGRYCFSLPNVINNYKVDKYLIEERVFVNFKEEIRASKTIKEGDYITIRGKGRFKINKILGQTKKGRLSVEIEK